MDLKRAAEQREMEEEERRRNPQRSDSPDMVTIPRETLNRLSSKARPVTIVSYITTCLAVSTPGRDGEMGKEACFFQRRVSADN